MQAPLDIFSLIRRRMEDAHLPVQVTDGYMFDHFETVNKIELYHASKFKSGDIDSLGNKKYFTNVSNDKAGNATKNIDIDVADVIIRGMDGSKDVVRPLLYREMLKRWMRDKRLGKLFNDTAERLPRYGQVVWQKVGPLDFRLTPLRWLYRDPATPGIQNSLYIVKRHFWQPEDLYANKSWDQAAVKKTLDAFFCSSDAHINGYEVYTWMPRRMIDPSTAGKPAGNEYVKAMAVCAMGISGVDAGADPHPEQPPQQIDIQLWAQEWKEPWPFKEVNFFEIEGRALGLGVMELNFDIQQRRNEMTNQKARSMKISSKLVFQTRDSTAEKNILTDTDDGDIIKTSSEIGRLPNEERNLNAYNSEEQSLDTVSKNLTAAQDVVTGANLPSGTSFRLGALLNQNASKLHEYVRENFGLFIEDVILDWVLPEFEKDIDEAQLFGTDDPELVGLLVAHDTARRFNESMGRFFMKFGRFPTEEEKALIQTEIGGEYRKAEYAKIIKGYFKGFAKKLEVIVTDENSKLQNKVENITGAIQLISQNPQAIADPRIRPYIDALFAAIGVDPIGAAPVNPALTPPQPQPQPGGEAMLPRQNMAGMGGGAGLSRSINRSVAAPAPESVAA